MSSKPAAHVMHPPHGRAVYPEQQDGVAYCKSLVPVGAAFCPHRVLPMAAIEVLNGEGLDLHAVETAHVHRDLVGVRTGNAKG